MSTNLFQQLLQAQRLFQDDLLSRANVVGVAVGYKNYKDESTDQLALAVLVEQKKPVEALTEEDFIPSEMDGAPTDVIEVGRLEAYVSSPRDRYRPTIPAGVSIGHYLVTAGTIGAVVYDKTTGEPLILSNNHVLANSNFATAGDPILQPGPTDHGARPNDVVAQLHRFEPIYFHGEVPPAPEPEPTPPPTTTPDPTPTQPPVDTTPDPTPTQPPVDTTPSPNPTTPVTPTTPTNPPTTGGGTGDVPSGSCDIVDFVVGIGNTLAKLNGSDKRLTSVPAAQVAAQSTGTTTATRSVSAQSTFIHNNQVDAALARPNNPLMFEPEIMSIGKPSGTKRPSLAMPVRKHGRTTGYTESTITLMNATVNVAYNTPNGTQQARFAGQCITTAMSQGGDSGSLIFEVGSLNAVGLLFAGSSRATIFTPIDLVLDVMNVRF